MTQKALFQRLGAPLVNARWSWGAVREADGAVILRVWQDNGRTYDNKAFVPILRAKWKRAAPTDHGARERVEHVERIRKGAQCYLIMCEAEDTGARPRRIRRFNAEEVFRGVVVREINGDVWVELLPGVPVHELAFSA